MFAALGDRLRLDIVDELALSDRTPGELIQKFEITSALLAHH
jgi:DNA-binding transcriptional ArsR family regulator